MADGQRHPKSERPNQRGADFTSPVNTATDVGPTCRLARLSTGPDTDGRPTVFVLSRGGRVDS